MKWLLKNIKVLTFMILAALLAFSAIKLLAFILCIGLWTSLLPFPKKINTYFLRSVLSVSLITCYIQLLGVVLWMLRIPFIPQVAILLLLAPLVPFLFSGDKENVKDIKPIDFSDIVSLVVAAGTVIFISLSLLNNNSLASLIRTNTNGFDDTIHTTLSINVYENKGYLYGTLDKTIDKVIFPELVAYPQGWYLSNTVWWNAINDHLSIQNSPRPLILLYTVTKIAWFGMIVFLFNRLILFLSIRVLGKLRLQHYLLSAVLTLCAEILVLFGIFKFGFSSFMPLIVYVLALGFLLSSSDVNDGSDKRDLQKTVLISTLFAGGITMSWLLGGPIGYIAIFLYLIHHLRYRSKALFSWITTSLGYSILLLITAGLGMSQLMIQVLYSVNHNLINTEGGLWPLNLGLIFVLIVAFLVYYSSTKFRSSDSIPYLLIPSLLIAGGVYVVQYVTAGNSTYYSTKTLYVPFILLLLFVSVMLVTNLNSMQKVRRDPLPLLLILSLLCVVPNLLRIDLNVLGQVSGRSQKISPYASSQIASIINDHQFNGNIVVDLGLDYEEDVIGTSYLTMLGRHRTECQRTLTWYLVSNNHDSVANQIGECAKETTGKYYVIASSVTYPTLHDKYKDNTKVEILLSN